MFIIRNGASGELWDTKFYMVVAGLVACFFDWRTRDRKDYFWGIA
ncbi:MAG: hypothetical protein ACTSU5_19460 [Promethearchaeota archaeon]